MCRPLGKDLAIFYLNFCNIYKLLQLSNNSFTKLMFFFIKSFTPGVGKLRPAKEKSAARGNFFNRMWPAKKNFAREHVNIDRREKRFLS